MPNLLSPPVTSIQSAVGRIAVGTPVNGIVEVAGPEQFRLDELIREGLKARQDPREVVTDPQSRYFGAMLSERTLVPADGATGRRALPSCGGYGREMTMVNVVGSVTVPGS